MNTKKILLVLIASSLLFACKKKEADPEPVTPEPIKVVNPEITFAQSIGTSGSGATEFNFNSSGSDMAWGMATDGNFVFVADIGNNCVKKVDLSKRQIDFSLIEE